MESVAAFTDTYLPTVNGVTYTVESWRDRWQARGGRMAVVYPGSPERTPDRGEYPVRSLPLPIYAGYRLGVPRVPDAVEDVDIVHAHTPFAVGLAGLRLARKRDLPLVASFHTPTEEYASYLSSWGPVRERTAAMSQRYESWFLDAADAVIVPRRRPASTSARPSASTTRRSSRTASTPSGSGRSIPPRSASATGSRRTGRSSATRVDTATRSRSRRSSTPAIASIER
ncbi:hypothetical protein SY89_02433 [Halolamina pelagica]|uniref:Glycosyltransferase subfamily 4-like N-terminal domain-containing protein n=1 Tax=Halolamina pelagica TaxID=699431 RepID=A0A0P7HX66_9EURY|nr:hypothetical protein SY89_02433 [Halolamina pelagica]